MKIKTSEMEYEKVLELPGLTHRKPKKQSTFFRKLMCFLSQGDLKKANFTYDEIGMSQLKSQEPCIILMNHSSFIDLEIAASIFRDKPFHIVCTYDGFVGKDWVMRKLGCIPTRKFTNELTLIKDMLTVAKDLKESILMYPEASYSFDGTETPLPESLGKCLKLLRIPVILVKTEGAFSRDPLYNNLQVRKVDVKAMVEYFLSPKDLEKMTADEINQKLKTGFTYDQFRWQQENRISIKEPFRADCLNRVLYRCPSCKQEGKMLGKGTKISCKVCKKSYELTEYGFLKAVSGETEFDHIPAWYRYQRDCVRKELEEGTYHMNLDVDIYMMVNTDCIYHVGEGTLEHSIEGFSLKGCDGKLTYQQKPTACYSLYSDFYWYEIGDVICIGNEKVQYYCFPKGKEDVVAKARLATEEAYKLCVVKDAKKKEMRD